MCEWEVCECVNERGECIYISRVVRVEEHVQLHVCAWVWPVGTLRGCGPMDIGVPLLCCSH